MADRKGIILYFDDWKPLLQLEDHKLALFLRAAINYAQSGEAPNICGELGILWEMIAAKIDLDGARFDKRVEDGEYAAYCREEKRAGRDPVDRGTWREERQISTDIDRYPSSPNTKAKAKAKANTKANTKANIIADKPPRSRFVPPTVEEVAAYCRERNNGISPEQFVDYYAARGWMMGKTKMQNWKGAVRTWERRQTDGRAARDGADDQEKRIAGCDYL